MQRGFGGGGVQPFVFSRPAGGADNGWRLSRKTVGPKPAPLSAVFGRACRVGGRSESAGKKEVCRAAMIRGPVFIMGFGGGRRQEGFFASRRGRFRSGKAACRRPAAADRYHPPGWQLFVLNLRPAAGLRLPLVLLKCISAACIQPAVRDRRRLPRRFSGLSAGKKPACRRRRSEGIP